MLVQQKKYDEAIAVLKQLIAAAEHATAYEYLATPTATRRKDEAVAAFAKSRAGQEERLSSSLDHSRRVVEDADGRRRQPPRSAFDSAGVEP